MKLYEYSEKLRAAIDAMEVNEDGEILNVEELEQAQAEWDEKAEAVACYIKEAQREAEALKAEEESFKARRKQKEHQVEYLKNYLQGQMESVGVRKFERTNCKVGIRQSEAVVIKDDDLVPTMYKTCKTEWTANKASIKEALKLGFEVPGAVLEVRQNVQVK